MSSVDVDPVVRRTRPKDRREQILRAAFTLISESGFNAVSLSAVAAACDIQKSSVLHHFGSMNELLLAVLHMRELEDNDFYREIPGPDSGSDPQSARDRFTRVFVHSLDRQEIVRLYSVLDAESLAPDHPAHEYFHDRGVLARAETARSLSWKANPDLAAAELLAFWSGLEVQWHHDPELDVRAVWETFCDRFFV